MNSIEAMGISAGYICGDEDVDDKAMKSSIEVGLFQLVFFTPEALLGKRRYRKPICNEYYQRRISGLVIDEAHTIKKW